MAVHKCHVCKQGYVSYATLVNHYQREHIDLLPDGKSIHQELFDNKRGNVNRTHMCTICKKNPVPWNDTTRRYERFCSKRCRDQARAMALANMRKKYGKDTLLNDPEHQQKMQYNRDISGTYTFKDGTDIKYMGSYEQHFLEFYENELNFPSKDIIECPFYFYYILDKQKHLYIPDYYITSLDLIVEIKDEDNTHPHMKLDRQKEALKDKVAKNSGHRYIKIVGKDYAPLLDLVMKIQQEG